jgi:hypothetical protein
MSGGAEMPVGWRDVAGEVPSADRFRRDRGSLDVQRWFVLLGRGAFDLCVPGDDEEPDPRSIEMAAGVLPTLPVIVEEAAAHLAAMVDARRRGLSGEPELVSVLVDARREQVTVELNWDADLYSLWHVTFTWRTGFPRHPAAFGRRDWVSPPS